MTTQPHVKRAAPRKVVSIDSATRRPQGDDPAREKRITALVSIIAVAHQIARRQIATERGYAA